MNSDKVNYQINNSRTTSTCLPATGVPIQDKYNGYGIMQITKGISGGLTGGACQSPLSQPTLYIPTTNTPTQNMIWNWVANINAGAAVMLDKYKEEIAYENKVFNDLNRNNLGYLWVSPTTEQRQMNVWQRYNGGVYWVWSCVQRDPITHKCIGYDWVRNTAFCSNPYPPDYQNKTCNGVFPSGGKCYADCTKYWSDNPSIATPNNPQWCQ